MVPLCPWTLFQILVLPEKYTKWPSSSQAISGRSLQQCAEFFPFCSRTEGPVSIPRWLILGDATFCVGCPHGSMLCPPLSHPHWSLVLLAVIKYCHRCSCLPFLGYLVSFRAMPFCATSFFLLFFNMCINNLPVCCPISIKMWSFFAVPCQMRCFWELPAYSFPMFQRNMLTITATLLRLSHNVVSIQVPCRGGCRRRQVPCAMWEPSRMGCWDGRAADACWEETPLFLYWWL